MPEKGFHGDPYEATVPPGSAGPVEVMVPRVGKRAVIWGFEQSWQKGDGTAIRKITIAAGGVLRRFTTSAFEPAVHEFHEAMVGDENRSDEGGTEGEVTVRLDAAAPAGNECRFTLYIEEQTERAFKTKAGVVSVL